MNKVKGLIRKIKIPEGLEVEVERNELHAKSNGEEIKRRFPKVTVEKEEKNVVIRTKLSTRRERKQINTIVAHINNIFKGLQEKFIYKLQICAVHFPINVSLKDNEIIIKNFLGESKERKVKIPEKVEVKIENDIIAIKSADKEAAGQVAANIEKATQIKDKDRRIFQDGIFMIEKAGKKV